MRRFLICAVTALALAAVGVYLTLYQGFYLDLSPNASLELPFRTQGKTIQIRDEAGNWAALEIRGVDLTADLPGQHATDFAPQEEDYLRWLEAIAAMGANTVRVHTIMDDHFYNALYQHNTAHDTPLYLLQGIQVTDAANYGAEDAYHKSFLGALLEEGVAVVDVIHGRRLLTSSEISGGGRYWRDISPWVIGYMMGHEWNADTIAYTDHSVIRDGLYAGTYFTTLGEATPFEAMLAQVMDSIISYESGKYNSQRIIGFASSPDVDFLEYEDGYARQLGKYAYLDPEHILPTAALKSGYYTTYRLFDFCDDFSEYLSQSQLEELSSLLGQVDVQRAYDGYLDLLSLYHSMPVLTSCGFSSARGAASMGEGPRTEVRQGEALMAVWEDAVRAGLSGLCISTWQDSWGRDSWNTAFAMDKDNSRLWHDLQSDSQNLGLLAFAPGEKSACLVDGEGSEWSGDTPVLEADGISLYIREDQEGLYLLLLGESVGPDTPLYLPMDMIEDVGSAECSGTELTFDRAAEFLLCLDGTDNSRLLVQERYNAMRMNFNYAQGGTDPFVDVPPADSPRFMTVSMAVDNPVLADTSAATLTAQELRQLQAMKSWETGRLVHGNGDPDSPDYNSLADFCYGEDCVELRLPWLLLNVADPVSMEAHRDYYVHYGVETLRLRECWIGLGDGEGTISLHSFRPQKVEWKPAWRERLKQSYYIVQEHWT